MKFTRNESGVVKISASSTLDFVKQQGYAHAHDRLVQMCFVRTIGEGKIGEYLKADEGTLAIDIFMREMAFCTEAQNDVKTLDSETRAFAQSYCDGVNEYLKKNRNRLEFQLVGYKPSPWEIKDSLLTIKLMSYIGLAQTQQEIEKFIIQAIKNEVDVDKLKLLFTPHLDDLTTEQVKLIKKTNVRAHMIPAAVKFLNGLPQMKASNNWSVAPSKSSTGSSLHCSDPHLETNRLPAVWTEQIATIGDNYFIGATMAGVPGIMMGRNKGLSFSFTYGFMDMLDYFIEEVKDGKYRNGDKYCDFIKRDEIIKRKGKSDVVVSFYENERGVLEIDSDEKLQDGFYLTRAWSCHKNGTQGSLVALKELFACEDAHAAQKAVQKITISTNWILSDTKGNLIYQQAGNFPKRLHSGLYPVEGWVLENNWQGLHGPEKFSTFENPESGFIATANNDLNQKGKPLSINMPMGSYRVDRVNELINAKEKVSIEDMKNFQKDLYSLQAKKLMEQVRPLIPDTPRGQILKDWDLCYDKNSKGAALFEVFYQELLNEIYGKHVFGENVWNYLVCETGLLVDYYHIFDRGLFEEEALFPWFDKDNNGKAREDFITEALARVLSTHLPMEFKSWGERQEIMMKNIFFDGTLPKFLGFDYGPIPIEGGRATIVQGAKYRSHGRETTFCPSWRFITDLGTNYAETALAGGPSDRRFSKWYTSDIHHWLNFTYKKCQAN